MFVSEFDQQAHVLEHLVMVARMWRSGLDVQYAHHTFVAGKEQPADTWKSLGKYVRHTHLKDSKPEGDERRYVLTGSGEVPVKEQVRVLAQAGYKGFYCFEWEKKWHPEIEEPEVAFPHFARTIREYLAEAGVETA